MTLVPANEAQAGTQSGYRATTAMHGTVTRYSYHGCRCEHCRAAWAVERRARGHQLGCDCLICDLAAQAKDAVVGIRAEDYYCDAVAALDRRRSTKPKTRAKPRPTLTVVPEPKPKSRMQQLAEQGPRQLPPSDLDDWQSKGACRGYSTDLFFPNDGEWGREAKAICDRCDVKTECLEHALDNHELWGVWGGTTGRERRRIRRTEWEEVSDGYRETR